MQNSRSASHTVSRQQNLPAFRSAASQQPFAHTPIALRIKDITVCHPNLMLCSSTLPIFLRRLPNEIEVEIQIEKVNLDRIHRICCDKSATSCFHKHCAVQIQKLHNARPPRFQMSPRGMRMPIKISISNSMPFSHQTGLHFSMGLILIWAGTYHQRWDLEH